VPCGTADSFVRNKKCSPELCRRRLPAFPPISSPRYDSQAFFNLSVPQYPGFKNREKRLLLRSYNIVTCRLVRVTKMTGSSSDDWIY
jgi:hypothetical protein